MLLMVPSLMNSKLEVLALLQLKSSKQSGKGFHREFAPKNPLESVVGVVGNGELKKTAVRKGTLIEAEKKSVATICKLDPWLS